eukprot:COSAG06_NODE_3693_length_4999_cov_204.219388_6_plen_98_part_00
MSNAHAPFLRVLRSFTPEMVILPRQAGSGQTWEKLRTRRRSFVVLVRAGGGGGDFNFTEIEIAHNVTIVCEQVGKRHFFAPILYKNEHFTKTGSGQT